MSRSGAHAQQPTPPGAPDASTRADPTGPDAAPPGPAPAPYARGPITLVGSLLGWVGMTMTLMMVHLGTHRYALGWLLLSAVAWGGAIGVVFEMLMHARAHDRAKRPGGWLTALAFVVCAALGLLLLAVAASWGPWQHD